MKIGSSIPNLPPSTESVGTAGGARAASVQGTGQVATDQVALSSAGASMQSLSTGSDFDTEKVEAIRQAIRDGRFTINAGAIADRLIADATALLGPKTH
jgi:negative regulator of flagellin synthesis FlgM